MACHMHGASITIMMLCNRYKLACVCIIPGPAVVHASCTPLRFVSYFRMFRFGSSHAIEVHIPNGWRNRDCTHYL